MHCQCFRALSQRVLLVTARIRMRLGHLYSTWLEIALKPEAFIHFADVLGRPCAFKSLPRSQFGGRRLSPRLKQKKRKCGDLLGGARLDCCRIAANYRPIVVVIASTRGRPASPVACAYVE